MISVEKLNIQEKATIIQKMLIFSVDLVRGISSTCSGLRLIRLFCTKSPASKNCLYTFVEVASMGKIQRAKRDKRGTLSCWSFQKSNGLDSNFTLSSSTFKYQAGSSNFLFESDLCDR